MLVTVTGILRPPMHHAPNGIQCDDCGAQENFDRKDSKQELARLADLGWTVPRGFDLPAYCPCHKMLRLTLHFPYASYDEIHVSAEGVPVPFEVVALDVIEIDRRFANSAVVQWVPASHSKHPATDFNASA